MSDMKFAGVMPAITTALKDDLSVDHPFIAKHVRWLVGTDPQASSSTTSSTTKRKSFIENLPRTSTSRS